MASQLTDRDRELLSILTRRVRVLSIEQIARTWFAEVTAPERAAKRRVGNLRNDGLLEIVSMLAHPEIRLTAPALKWLPGNEAPDFGKLAYQLKARWNQSPQPTQFVLASSLARQRFGGFIGDRNPRPSEARHDLHMAQVYLFYRESRPAWAKRWVSEHQLYAEGGGRNERLPDAVVRDAAGRRDKDYIVEFGGAYSKTKLNEFHAALSHLRYEIW